MKEAFIMGGNDGIGAKYAGGMGSCREGGTQIRYDAGVSSLSVLYH